MSRILVIDDDKTNRSYIAELLKLDHFEVETARDGLEGIQVARETLPDLIVCDIMMPDLSGYEVLQELRDNSITAMIPFVFLSAKAQRHEVRLGMELGADDYLTKPFRDHELLGAIRAQLQKRTTLELQQLRNYRQRFVRLQEHERRSVAQQIQESVVGPLAGIQLSLNGLRQIPVQQLDQAIESLEELTQAILAHVDDVVWKLSPIMLDDLGLLPALLHHIEQFSARTQITTHFTHHGLDQSFPQEIKTTLFRVIEEALSNVEKHAQVGVVTINAQADDKAVVMTVADEGVGFDLEALLNSGAGGGLIDIRERVAGLGGELNINTSKGGGVQISANVPFAEERAALAYDFADESPVISQSSVSAIPNNLRGTQRTRIVIAEQHEIICEGLERLLEAEYEVIGKTSERGQVLNILRALQPDLLILGFVMSSANNLELIKPAVKVCPGLRILILSGHDNELYAYEAIRNGASGYVLYNAGGHVLQDAVEAVTHGDQYWISPDAQEAIMQRHEDYYASDPDSRGYNILTLREREILAMIAQGNTSKQIAGLLSISPRTAETHRSNIARKLGLRTQSDLIRFAFEHGLAGNTLSQE